MSLVEKAIRKIQEQHRSATEAVVAAEPIALGDTRSEAPRSQAASAERPPALVLEKGALRAAGLFPPADDEQRLAHQYRKIKRPLIANAMGRGAPKLPKGYLIMLASAMAGEGKSFTAVNLALSLALEKDVSVLLVDADLPKPQLTRVFGLQDERGLLDVLRDPALDVESLIRPTDVPTLSFLPAGMASSEATELLASSRMDDVARRLGQTDSRRIVLLDTPPLMQTTESPALAAIAGQIVVIVRAEFTPQPVLLDALKMLKGHQSVSLILNQSTRSAHSAYYYYGYGEASQRPPRA